MGTFRQACSFWAARGAKACSSNLLTATSKPRTTANPPQASARSRNNTSDRHARMSGMATDAAALPGPPRRDPTEARHLPKQMRLRDLVLAQVLTVVGSSWVGIAAGLGRAQLVAWLGAFALFYLPMAVAV